jgi:serine/threonine-protein kinase
MSGDEEEQRPMIGQTISHYQIVEKLGEGGMGVVYKARDTKLDRLVALKFLPHHLTVSEQDKQRFIHEAKSAASLNHPNIATVYEIDEYGKPASPNALSGKQLFIALEYIEGQTLAQMIYPDGEHDGEPLPVNGAISFAIQIAEGLSAAHKKGIVHRDIKSNNVMVTNSGQVKIMDFGLAKSSAATMLTKKETTLGTVPYMSPEQARGEKVDHQTDIWSLGVVLFEMITGRLPFKSDYNEAVIYSILNESPLPLSTFRSDVPQGLQSVVDKALSKKKEERYRSIDELIVELRSLRTLIESGTMTRRVTPEGRRVLIYAAIGFFVVAVGTVLYFAEFKNRLSSAGQPVSTLKGSSKEQISIAMLPFVSMSESKEDEYFSDGMTDALINDLARLPGLRVIARTSVFQYKGKNVDLRKVGEELNVKYLLEGSVQRSGNQLRVGVQLIDATSGYNLWADRYNEQVKDIFAVQDDITGKVIGALKLTLGGNFVTAPTASRTANTAAYDWYLKGRYALFKYTEKDLRQSLEFFGRAIAADSNFASAWSGIAEASTYLADDWLSPHEAYPNVFSAARRAIALDSLNVDAHLALSAPLLWYEWDAKSAEREALKAIMLNASSADAHGELGVVYGFGYWQWDLALEEFRRAIELDPLSAYVRVWESQALSMLGRYDEAMISVRRALQLDSTYAYAWLHLGDFLLNTHRYKEAADALDRAKQGSSSVPLLVAELYARTGKVDDAKRLISIMEKERQHHYIRSESFASAYLVLGDQESALRWLGRAVDDHSAGGLELAHHHRWDSLRSDPRFDSLAHKVTVKQ